MSWAIWITGPPASGKTTLARAFLALCARTGLHPVHLESDVLRAILTPGATYETAERDRFYRQLAELAALLTGQGVPVVVDATASRRAYRDYARSLIAGFAEVFVDAPEAVRRARDPKGLYARAAAGKAPHLPGATSFYEAPEAPEVSVDGTRPPEEGAEALLAWIRAAGW